MRKLTKVCIVLAVLFFILIVTKLLLLIFDLHTLIELRFRLIFSFPFLLLCLAAVGLVLGILTIRKRPCKVLAIVSCAAVCAGLFLSIWFGTTFGYYHNSKTFIRVGIPNSNEVAVLNPDGVVPAWVGKRTGMACYVQVNQIFLKEIKPQHCNSGSMLKPENWRSWENINRAYEEGNYYWDGYALVFNPSNGYEMIAYDYSAYIKPFL